MPNSPSTFRYRSTRRHFLLESGAATLVASAPLAGEPQESTGAPPGRANLARRIWHASWIAVPGAPANEYGVYYFRRTFELSSKPERFVVHVSGDNRYQLFVNGHRVAWGPARGGLSHWRYETVDAAPILEPGRNVFAAVVWNFGELAPEAQEAAETGFLVEGDGPAESVVNTGTNWKCVRDESYSPVPPREVRAYYAAGPGDCVAGPQHPWGWEGKEFDDSGWPAAVVIGPAAGREARDAHTRWMLLERPIPVMEERPERLQRVRRVVGIPQPAAFPAQPSPFEIPARTHATLLLDQTYLTTAYPELTVSGGRDAVVTLGYAESLYLPAADGNSWDKGNRDEVEGKQFIGVRDQFIADGGSHRTFRPLWWRAYRYLELDVETKDSPLAIEDLHATYVGYPFERRAQFDGGSVEVNRILDVGWRTARLCAHETYMDCPYYEQLQYVGDTRVQCLISIFNSGDTRLMRNAIGQIDDSRLGDACTMSRYPTRLEQYIPGFSLWWIAMVRDYWWYVDDPAFVRRMLPGVRAVLSFFEAYQKKDGSLGLLPWWRYFDWVPEWPSGEPPQEADGSSAPYDLLLLLAYRWAAELEDALGLGGLSEVYQARASQLRETAHRLYWDAGKRLFADTPARRQFSQHTNTMAVLADVITGTPARDLMLHTLSAPGLAQAALFFKFYMNLALVKVGEGDRYLDQLGDWRGMLARGLTTFAETVDLPNNSSRSDCHAWSASPNIEIFRTLLGVDSAAPGFSRVVVRPHLNKLQFVSGSVPHPKGKVEVRLEPRGAGMAANITLPHGVPGEFVWRGARRDLAPGVNRFSL
ncbi:MAG: alpha-L-rhamnosidase C-terminal domain-containing protein [Bryobacteraceae bacterium]|jgi:hypothetical protein